jgi:hypothetical protein
VSRALASGYLGLCAMAAATLLLVLRLRMPPEYRTLRASGFV